MLVLQRQKAPVAAAATPGIEIGALPAVALPHLAGYFDRHMARPWFQQPPLTRSARASLPPQLALDESVDSALEQCRQLAARQRVAQELSGLFDLGDELRARRKLDSVARRRQWLELGLSRRVTWPGTGRRCGPAGSFTATGAGLRQSSLARYRTHPGLDIGSRKPACQYLFNRSSRLAARLGEQRFRVLFAQMRREQEETGQVQRSAAELLEHGRQPLRQSRYPHALERFVFTVAEAFDTKRIERRTCLFEKQSPALDLDQVLDDVGDGCALAVYQDRHSREQIGIGNGRRGFALHLPCITRGF